MSAIFKSSRQSIRCLQRVVSLRQCIGLPSLTHLSSAQQRYFGGGGKGDDTVPHSPVADTTENDLNNPYLWDPHYQPCEETDFDRDPQDVRIRQPLPRESFVPAEEVLTRISHILRGMERAQTDGKSINENTHLSNDLGLDSLDQVEFGLALEDEFDIEIPDEEAEQIVTIGDAVELIADHPHAK